MGGEANRKDCKKKPLRLLHCRIDEAAERVGPQSALNRAGEGTAFEAAGIRLFGS
jgi:hypothetical protein